METGVFRRKWLVQKDCGTHNSDLNLGHCARYEEGIKIMTGPLFLFMIVLHLLQDLF